MSSDKYDTENQSELVHPVLLLAEGKSDVSFLMKLLSDRGVGGLHFAFPTDVTGGFGKTGFGKYLNILPTRTGFERLKAILILYDNDSDPAAEFVAARNSVSANESYSVPTEPIILANAQPDKVRLMFVPMPGVGVSGALETLLLQSTTDVAALACVDALVVCAGCGQWAHSHDAKMRLRCLISVKCKGNSDMALTHIWGKPGNPIDLTHACFDGLVETVRVVAASA